jgi:tRNA modification GTPase
MINDDTIAALATASGPGAISIVRVSGPGALSIADTLFHCPAPPPSERSGGTFVHGKIGFGKHVVDEGLLLIFRQPRSYTRDDVVEFQCHGGRESGRRILTLVLEAGARAAEPGEFTRRAFLNGRLDLVQAEAVMDLISAQSSRAAEMAVEQLTGRLSESIRSIYDQVIGACADLEATLDFPEEDFPDEIASNAVNGLRQAIVTTRSLIDTWEEGHRLREGALVVISGRPNAGKSTLLNRLLGKERAIVAPTPGTTRDTLEESFILNGIPIRLVDTAGLRETGCEIEQAGIARAKDYIGKADLRLHVVDASEPFSDEDRALLNSSSPEKTIVLLNKSDLNSDISHSFYDPYTCLRLSLKQNTGLVELLEDMRERLDWQADAMPHAAISERHRQLLSEALNDMHSAFDLIEKGHMDGLVLAAAHLHEAAAQLGRLTGRLFYQDMLDQIFSRFCIGK